MPYRKSESANLESIRQVFLSLGFLIVSGIVFSAFSYKSYNEDAYDYVIELDEELIEIPQLVLMPEKVKFKAPVPPPPSPVLSIIEILDEIEVPKEKKEDLQDPSDFMLDDSLFVIDEPAEPLDTTPMMFTKDMPYYSECAGLVGRERDHCTTQLIHELIKNAYVIPNIAIELGWEETVYVRFVINRDGNVEQVEVVKSANEVLDKAAIDAVMKLPKAHPGMNLDKPVSIVYTVPVKINFR